MSTTLKSTEKSTWLDQLAWHYEQTPFAGMALVITAQSCWASIAAALAVQLDVLPFLMICAAVTMGTNAICIAQGPPRWCVGAAALSVVLNTLMIITMLLL